MQCPFAIRSGGHSPSPGFASVGESGIVIDLSSLNTITLSDTKDIASVGPGATLDKVYEVLEKDKLAVVGGRAPGVDIGGLITGGLSSPSSFLPLRITFQDKFGEREADLSYLGGMSHFSNRWGMVCDNVNNFEVSKNPFATSFIECLSSILT
jgi:FAD/FMN-containing dehydrogenase